MDTATDNQQQMMQRPRDEHEEINDKDVNKDDFEMLQDNEQDLKVHSFIVFNNFTQIAEVLE